MPRGTCYWADAVEVAVRERLAHHVLTTNTVFASRAREMVVVAARASRGRRFADVTHPAAVRWGVGAELQTMGDYRVPQAWARALDAAGFAGVRYSTRFTSASAANAWAVFGAAASRGGRVRSACTATGSRRAAKPGSGCSTTGRSPGRSASRSRRPRRTDDRAARDRRREHGRTVGRSTGRGVGGRPYRGGVVEPVDAWWRRRQWSRGVAVPYAVGEFRSAWASYPC